jgi:mannose-6-phosphate isomerase-like protein (cupin superfamily)
VIHVNLAANPEFLAGDHTRLRELLHPAKHPLALGYSMAHGVLTPGARSKRHRLASSEVYYIIAGHGRLTVDGAVVAVEPGSVIYVPPGGTQSLENVGATNIEFLCLVDPACRPEDEEVLE